ncbi:hypothetical protein LTR85_009063 [Meristemomyces frigidus]|nr:hypothetical protein LTR85_009063 [Meristemomyces frigidus]
MHNVACDTANYYANLLEEAKKELKNVVPVENQELQGQLDTITDMYDEEAEEHKKLKKHHEALQLEVEMLKETAGGEEGVQERIVLLEAALRKRRGNPDTINDDDRERLLLPNSKRVADRKAARTKKAPVTAQQVLENPVAPRGRYGSVEDVLDEDGEGHDRQDSRRRKREQTTSTQASKTGSIRTNPDLAEAFSSRTKCSDPQKSRGTGKPTIYEWMRDMEIKLDCTEFRSEQAAIQYIHSRTKGTVGEYLEARVLSSRRKQQPANVFTSAGEMLEDLDTRFGKSDRDAKAHVDLANLKQGQGEKFSVFYIKYQKSRARGVWDDTTEKFSLTRMLNARYGTRTNNGELYANAQAIVDRCYRLETAFSTMDASQPAGSSTPTNNNNNRSGNSNRGGGGSSSDTQRDKASPAATAAHAAAHGAFLKKYAHLKNATAAEKTECRKNGTCMRCRKKGHLAKDSTCPVFWWIFDGNPRGVNVNNLNASSSAVSEDSENGETAV